MAYNDFTLGKIRQQVGLIPSEGTDLFRDVPEMALPPSLASTLERYTPVARNLRTEKAKSEFIIAPILMELKLQFADRISLFSGMDLTVDPAQGLNGPCDFLIARSPEQLDLIAPVCVVVEAKNEDIAVDSMEYPIQMAGRIYAILTRMALGE